MIISLGVQFNFSRAFLKAHGLSVDYVKHGPQRILHLGPVALSLAYCWD